MEQRSHDALASNLEVLREQVSSTAQSLCSLQRYSAILRHRGLTWSHFVSLQVHAARSTMVTARCALRGNEEQANPSAKTAIWIHTALGARPFCFSERPVAARKSSPGGQQFCGEASEHNPELEPPYDKKLQSFCTDSARVYDTLLSLSPPKKSKLKTRTWSDHRDCRQTMTAGCRSWPRERVQEAELCKEEKTCRRECDVQTASPIATSQRKNGLAFKDFFIPTTPPMAAPVSPNSAPLSHQGLSKAIVQMEHVASSCVGTPRNMDSDSACCYSHQSSSRAPARGGCEVWMTQLGLDRQRSFATGDTNPALSSDGSIKHYSDRSTKKEQEYVPTETVRCFSEGEATDNVAMTRTSNQTAQHERNANTQMPAAENREHVSGSLKTGSAQSRLVLCDPTVNESAPCPRLHLPRMTGLMDQSDISRLRMNLLKAAEAVHLMVWTRDSLVDLHPRQLVQLEDHILRQNHDAGTQLVPYIRTTHEALGLIPLHEKSRVFDCLKVQDKSLLCNSNKNVDLRLDADVFKESTRINTGSGLTSLKKALFSDEECQKSVLSLCSSPISEVSLSEKACTETGLPSGAKFMSFCYPCAAMETVGVRDSLAKNKHSASKVSPDEPAYRSCGAWVSHSSSAISERQALLVKLQQSDCGGVNLQDPFVRLLVGGGFLYFNSAYDIVAIHAIDHGNLTPGTRIEVSEWLSTEEKEVSDGCQAACTIYLGKPSTFPEESTDMLEILDRWRPATSPVLSRQGYTHYAWVNPSEAIGCHVYARAGGFACKCRDKEKNVYFPVVSKDCDEDVVPGPYLQPDWPGNVKDAEKEQINSNADILFTETPPKLSVHNDRVSAGGPHAALLHPWSEEWSHRPSGCNWQAGCAGDDAGAVIETCDSGHILPKPIVLAQLMGLSFES